MSLAQLLRTAAQSDDFMGYVCPITNKVLTAFLAAEDRQHRSGPEHARMFMLIVAEALDDGEADRAARFFKALTWALGSNGLFRARELGEGAYWWRKELQARAGLEWTGSEFVDGDVSWLTLGVPTLDGGHKA